MLLITLGVSGTAERQPRYLKQFSTKCLSHSFQCMANEEEEGRTLWSSHKAHVCKDPDSDQL